MSDKKCDERKIFFIAAAIIVSSFIISSQYVQSSMAQGMIQQGQLAGFDATGNQTANQSALLGDPAKMTVPSQPVD